MTSPQDRDLLITARLGEAQYLFESARSHFHRADQAFALGATGIAAAIGIAAHDEHLTADLLVALPSVALGLVTYILQTVGDVLVMETARLRIEEELAKTMDGESPLIYQRWANRRQRRTRTPGIVASFIVVGAGLVALVVIGGMNAGNVGADGALPIYCVVTAAFALTTILSLIDTARAERVTRRNLEGWPSESPVTRCYEDMRLGERQLAELFDGAAITWPWKPPPERVEPAGADDGTQAPFGCRSSGMGGEPGGRDDRQAVDHPQPKELE